MKPVTIALGSTILPFFDTCLPCSFPSPAQDYVEEDINLQTLLIQHPLSTFLIKVKGDSMINACIPDGAILIVDKSLTAKNKDIIVAVVNGEFTVKRLIKKQLKFFLQPENEKYKTLEIVDGMEFTIWGVVTKILVDPKNI